MSVTSWALPLNLYDQFYLHFKLSKKQPHILKVIMHACCDALKNRFDWYTFQARVKFSPFRQWRFELVSFIIIFYIHIGETTHTDTYCFVLIYPTDFNHKSLLITQHLSSRKSGYISWYVRDYKEKTFIISFSNCVLDWDK